MMIGDLRNCVSAAARALAAAALLCTAASAGLAQTPGGEATFIYAGQVLDRPGNAPRGPTTIIVRDGKIAELRDGYADAPAGARSIDLKNRFVLPGLIDAHVHLSSGGGDDGMLPRLAAYRTWANAQATLRAGFTTVRNLGDSDGTTMALREAIKRGLVTGPRILDAGRALTTTLGHGDGRIGMSADLHDLVDSGNICDGADECRKAVRRQIGLGADVIKIVVTGLSSVPVGPDRGGQMTYEETRAIVETAHAFGRKVAAHAHGGAGFANALRAGVDSIEHGTLMSEEDVALLKRSGAYYDPTLPTLTTYRERLANPALTPEERAVVEARLAIAGRSTGRALRAGVPFVFGSDAGFSQHGDQAIGFVFLTEFGLSPMQALVAGTTNGAALLGLGGEIGSLEPGKFADIIAVDGDPLRDIATLRAMKFVMREGVVYRSE